MKAHGRAGRFFLAILLGGLVLTAARPASGEDAYTLPGKSIDSVFLVGYAWERGSIEIVGTAWTIAPSTLATAAHAARVLSDAQDAGARIVARRGLLDRRELVIGEITIHPAYSAWSPRLERMVIRQQNELKNFAALPVADVALMKVIAGDPGPALPCIDPASDPTGPSLGSPVAYLGYPTENLSGFAVLHLTPCSITAMTDYFFQRVPWPEAYLIHLAGVATGGASGSPVLNPAGNVIGILSASENVTVSSDLEASRIPIGYIYAQRIDLAQELLAGQADAVQALRNADWIDRALQVFLPPGELLDRIVEQYSSAPPGGEELVLDSEYTIEEGDSLFVPLTLEPGYSYQACALAHDGTDIDGAFLDGAGGSLDEDTATDQYPVLRAGPLEEESASAVQFWAAEPLLGRTAVSLRVVRHGASDFPEPFDVEGAIGLEGMTTLFEDTIAIESDGEQRHDLVVDLPEPRDCVVVAVSSEDRDIDLEVYVDDTFYDSDWAFDSRPVVPVANMSGTIRVVVVFPAETEAGDSAIVRVFAAASLEGGD